MSIQSVEYSNGEPTLLLQWKLYQEGIQSIRIDVSTDSDFSKSTFHYLVPASTKNISLALSQGMWYFRLGALLSTKSVDWTATFGPVLVNPSISKATPSTPQSSLRVNYTQSITNGIRLHTNKIQKGMYCIDYSADSTFSPDSMKTQFYFDSFANGYADCIQLHPNLTYAIRICHFDTLPTNSILQLPSWTVLKNQKPYPLTKRSNSQESAGVKAAEMTMLQEARERPLRFSSQTEYLAYVTAKAKNSNTLQKN